MAVKGGHGGHGNGSRGRSYGLLLMLAFGAAIFGVMILHKLRERRIFNLLVQEKDHQLISLQLLLQKEKVNAKDAKRQIEEMKAKMYKLRTKNLDLETRILEMESTISSLREEQRTIASTLEEKQKEIKMLMDHKRGENQESARFMALSEALRKKEAEIEELKQRVELPVKVWSASADDPSNLPTNLTTKAAGERNGSEARASGEESGMLHDADTSPNENAESKSGETSAKIEDKMQDETNETSEEQHHKQEDSEQVFSNTSMGNVDHLQEEKGHDRDTEAEIQNNSEVNAINSNEVRTIIGDESRNIVHSESNDVVKLGKEYNSENIGRRIRGRRRRISVKNRGGSDTSLKSEIEGVESMRSRISFTESMESEREKRAAASELKIPDAKQGSNESTLKDPNTELPNKIDGETVKSNMDGNDTNITTAANEKSADGRDKSHKVDSAETLHQMEEGQEIKVTTAQYDKSGSNLQNMPANSTFLEDTEFLNKTENQKSEENGESEEGTNTIRENKDGEDREASRITEKDVKEYDLEVEDDQETETEGETSRNSTSDAEEDDEPEF